MNIKVNGVNISVENGNININTSGNNALDPDISELNAMSKSIESLGAQIDNDLVAYKLISNVKAVESFGYKSTEGVGESIKNAAVVVGRKIVQFFQKIVQVISTFISKGIANAKISMAIKRLEKDNGQHKTVVLSKGALDSFKDKKQKVEDAYAAFKNANTADTLDVTTSKRDFDSWCVLDGKWAGNAVKTMDDGISVPTEDIKTALSKAKANLKAALGRLSKAQKDCNAVIKKWNASGEKKVETSKADMLAGKVISAMTAGYISYYSLLASWKFAGATAANSALPGPNTPATNVDNRKI